MPIRIEGLGNLLKSFSRGAETPDRSIRGTAPTVSGLVRTDLRGTAFLNAVEKHLSDYKSGNGHLSQETGIRLQEADQTTRSIINSNSPKLAATYAGYASGLSYTRRARFIEGVNSAQQRVAEINALRETAPTEEDVKNLFFPAKEPLDVEA